ncbi:unnamed protein product [Closterium sp. NIES-64]|nr:unnamed protein product [Closterium sp. NIES-64]
MLPTLPPFSPVAPFRPPRFPRRRADCQAGSGNGGMEWRGGGGKADKQAGRRGSGEMAEQDVEEGGTGWAVVGRRRDGARRLRKLTDRDGKGEAERMGCRVAVEVSGGVEEWEQWEKERAEGMVAGRRQAGAGLDAALEAGCNAERKLAKAVRDSERRVFAKVNAVNSVQKKHPRLLSQLVFVNGRPHFQTTSSGAVEVDVIENIPESIAASIDGNGEGSEEFLDDSFEIGRRCSIDVGGGKTAAEEEGLERSELGRSGFKMSLCQDHWLRIVESAMNEPWNCCESSVGEESASLLCFRMYRLHEGRSLILFRAHTSVCDRKSAGIIVEDLLSFLDDEVNGSGSRSGLGSANDCSGDEPSSQDKDQSAKIQKEELPVSSLKDVESCIPPELSRKPFWAHGLDVVGYGLNSRRYSWLPFHDSSSERQSALIRSGLSRSDTERLKQACEKQNITLFGAVACAALKAVASVKELGRKGEHFAVTTFLDCRPLLSHEITLDTVGFYHSAMMHTHQVSETSEFWDLAKRCHESTLHAIKNRKHYTDMGDLNMLMAQAILHPQLTPESSLRTSTVCSFWDALHERMQKETTTAQATNAEATTTPMDASAAANDTDSPAAAAAAAATGEDKPAAKDAAAVDDKPAADAAPAAAVAGAGAESKAGEGGADKGEAGEGEKKTAAFSAATRAEILRQVEYYLSDSNLPRDRFMQEKLQEGNGFVPLALLCTFSRMRKHLGVLPDAPVPAHLVRATYEVLQASTFLKFSDDGKLVGREGEVAMGKERIAEINARSLFAEPFQWNSTLDDIHAFFSSLGPVKSVCMRRHPASKAFKGSVYVEFDSEDAMRLVAAKKDVLFNGATLLLQPKNEWLQQAREEWQKRVAEKGEEAGRFEAEDGDMDLRPPAKARRVEEGGERGADGEGAQGGEGAEAEGEEDEEEEDAYPKGLILGYTIVVPGGGDGGGAGEKGEEGKDEVGNGEVKGDEAKKEGEEKGEEGKKEEGEKKGEEKAEEGKAADDKVMVDAAEVEKKTEEEGKKAEEKVEEAKEGKADETKEEDEKKDGEKAEEKAGEKAEDKAEEQKKGAEGEALGKRKREEKVVAEGVTREECRFVFEKFGIVKFVEYKAGDLTGFIRFETPEGPIKANNKAKSAPAALTIKGYPVTVNILDGEEEAAYWSKLRDGQKKRKDFGGGRFGGGGFRPRFSCDSLLFLLLRTSSTPAEVVAAGGGEAGEGEEGGGEAEVGGGGETGMEEEVGEVAEGEGEEEGGGGAIRGLMNERIYVAECWWCWGDGCMVDKGTRGGRQCTALDYRSF